MKHICGYKNVKAYWIEEFPKLSGWELVKAKWLQVFKTKSYKHVNLSGCRLPSSKKCLQACKTKYLQA